MSAKNSKTYRYSPKNEEESKVAVIDDPNYLHNSRVSNTGVYRQTLASLMPKGEEFGEVIRLAYSTETDQIVIDEDGLYLLQKYSTASIGFLGIIGQDDLSKKFFLDTGLSLCGCQGNQFTSVYSQQEAQGIFVWSLPITPTPKVKLFLLLCSGLPPAFQQLHRRHQILLDLTLLLSSSLVVFNSPNIFAQKNKRIFQQEDGRKPKGFDGLPFIIKDLETANKRIFKDSCLLRREDVLWPQTAFFLQPFKFPTSVQIQAQDLFSRCQFTEIGSPLLKEQTVEELLLSLNEQTLKVDSSFIGSVGELMLSLIGSGTVKEYQGLKLSGNLVCKLLINSTKYMTKKEIIKLDKIFSSIFKELYEASYIYHCQNYEELLQAQFQDEEPLSEDNLLLTLQSTADTILASFNQHSINSQAHQIYQRQLLEHIEKKERLIMDVNMRKNEQIIAGKIRAIQQQTPFEPQYIKKYIESLKTIVRDHDHTPIELIVSKLLKYSDNLEQRIIDQQVKKQKEQIAILKEALRAKYKEYMKSKEVNDEVRRDNLSRQNAYKKSLKELHSFDIKLKGVKKDIQAQRKFQKQYIITKQSKKEAAEKLLEQIREVEEKVREYNRQMEDINKEYDYHPDVLALHKCIEDKEKQIRQLDKNESRLYSNINHSLVRSAIQKIPESASHLRKSVVNQGDQKGSEVKVPERKTIKRLTASKK